MLPFYLDLQFAFLSYLKLMFKIQITTGIGLSKKATRKIIIFYSPVMTRHFGIVSSQTGKSNFETDNEKIFNVTELAMLRVMTMMTGELDATDLLLNFSDFNFRNSLK